MELSAPLSLQMLAAYAFFKSVTISRWVVVAAKFFTAAANVFEIGVLLPFI